LSPQRGKSSKKGKKGNKKAGGLQLALIAEAKDKEDLDASNGGSRRFFSRY